ncbi:FtsB family cell division protein [Bryobacter aggregatus]|uniref:FtsB family cell division protein n=1 Tax=Bryobacter aggregatus TaxID=360054 RepID=UPI0009B5CB27|nr:septum formation initiator family protein [Bryobacter aggregatus]
MFESALIRRAGITLGLLTAGVYVVVALLGPNGVAALRQQRHDLQLLETRNANLARERDELRYRVTALEKDAQTQELEARRQLGKAKKGEFIIKVDPPKQQ